MSLALFQFLSFILKSFLFHIQYCPYNHLGLQAMFSIIALIWNTKQSEPMIHGRSIIWKKSKPRLWKLDQGISVMTSRTPGQIYTQNKDVYTVHKKSYVYTKNMVVGNRGWSGTEEETIIKILSDKQIDYSLIIHFRSQK